MRTECRKLARDHIPELMDGKGVAYDASTLSDDGFREALHEKLLEEAWEVVRASRKEQLEELADLQEVLDTAARLSGFAPEQVRAVQLERREARGGFQRRILLHWFEE